jgi:hypothetical protein
MIRQKSNLYFLPGRITLRLVNYSGREVFLPVFLVFHRLLGFIQDDFIILLRISKGGC